jgi:tetratricopeptide (TPR) repeat protein
MQETIRNGLEGDTQYIEALFNMFGRLVIYKSGVPDARELFDLFLPHSSAVADQIVESFKFDSFKLDIAVRIYNMIAIGLEETGRLRESKDYLRKIETVQSLNLSGEEDEHTAIIYNNSSDVYMNLGLYKEAFDYAEKALAIFKKINGEEHFYTAGAYNTLAVVCGKMGNTKDAQKYLETAQEIFAKQKDEDNPNTATVYNNMANTALQEGDFAKALDLSEKALAIRLKVLGQGHPLTGASYQGVAVTCMLLDQDDRARENYNKALAVFRVTLGLEHPNTGTVFQSLGDLSLKQNDEEQAREWYAKALKIFDKVFGREHPATEALLERIDDVGGMESLPPPESFDPNAEKKLSEEADEHFDAAIDLEDEGDEEGAIEEYTKCLELRPNEYDAYVYRAALYEKQGKPDLAIADYSEALKIYPDKWEPWDFRGQQYAEALKDDEAALADLREAAELNPQEAPKVIYNVALHCYRAEDYERAILYFSEYINLTFQSDALDAYYLRALCYFQKGNTERAIADLKKAADLGSEKALAKLKEMKNEE